MEAAEIAKKIKNLDIQGAENIANASIRALEIFIKKTGAKSKKEFLAELEKTGKILTSARPSAIALPNAVNFYIKEIEKIKGNDLDLIKKKALEIGNKFLEKNKTAIEKISNLGAGLIKNNSTVLIHCHSSTLIDMLKKAKKLGKKFSVVCTETRPWGQGFISARELANAGISVTLIVDSAVASIMQNVDMVFVGADTITKDKKLINKIGTAQIALIAKNFKVPFYAAAQSLKFTGKNAGQIKLEERPKSEILGNKILPAGVKIKNVVFDVTDSKYITAFITENGIKKIYN